MIKRCKVLRSSQVPSHSVSVRYQESSLVEMRCPNLENEKPTQSNFFDFANDDSSEDARRTEWVRCACVDIILGLPGCINLPAVKILVHSDQCLSDCTLNISDACSKKWRSCYSCYCRKAAKETEAILWGSSSMLAAGMNTSKYQQVTNQYIFSLFFLI